MRLEIVRSLAEALGDVTTGVNAQLVDLPTDPGDNLTGVKVFVTDQTQDPFTAMGENIPRGVDFLAYVVADGPTVTERANIKGEYSLGTTPIAITVAHRGAAEPDKRLSQVEYVMRAIVLSVAAFFASPEANRVRNQITIMRTSTLAYGLIADDGAGALGAVTFTVQALDKRAQRLH